MTNILTTQQIIQKFLDFYKSAQPALTTQPGSVARDLFVDGPSIRIAELYNDLSAVSNAQSISQSVGDDLDNLASNYAVPRASPGKASGPAVLTFNSLLADIVIPGGSIAYSRNGTSFRIISGSVISTANESQYKALAVTYRADLDFIGITDQYAVQVFVECTSVGTNGNIPKYSLSSISIPGISGITNTTPFSGGSSPENDASYAARILSVFSGSNTGTTLGYQNVVQSNPMVIDAVVVGPGDPLMTRDNSIQEKDANGDLVLDSNGDPIIISEGTGGKVDVFAYGRRLTENVDSYVYSDNSGKNDPTQSVNDFTLGQIADDAGKSIMQKRKDDIDNGVLPNQPVENIVEVVGSLSGTFTSQIIDQYGNSYGNYTLLKDTGTYAGTVWGFDKLHWIRNYSLNAEDITRATFNGQDALSFTGATSISQAQRIIQITNENSTVSAYDKSQLTLNHTPIRAVNRVLNLTTGERYVVSNRNPGGSSSALNTSGNIVISGKNLPATSDILQVDYEWVYYHDIFTDLDNFTMKDNPRVAIDTVDWGYGNAIRREQTLLADGYTVVTQHLISAVVSVNKVVKDFGTVSLNSSGNGYIITSMSQVVSNVVSVKRMSDGAELYNTKKQNGSFDTNRIILPTDTSAQLGDAVQVTYNALDLYTINGSSGNFKDNVIYLPQDAQLLVSSSDILETNYIANISELMPSTNLSSLPAVKFNNGFLTNTSPAVFGVQPVTNIYGGIFVIENLRRTPAKIGLNISGITANGVINIRGITSRLMQAVIFSNVSSGLTLDLSMAIKQALGMDTLLALPSNIKVSRLISLEKVQTLSGVVTGVTTTYDITGYALKDNSFALDESIKNTALSVTEVTIPSTTTNLANEPILGDQLRISFYVTYDNDSENISFSTNGTLYTNKSFAYITSISVSSGFKSVGSIAGAISLFALNQPPSGTRYTVTYQYTTPKIGERITVRYNNNALIGDLTMSLEDKRSITADVVIKSALSILVDVTATVTPLKEYSQTANLVRQNVGDRIASYITNLDMGTSLAPSDLINVAYQVAGIAAITIDRFNKANIVGNAKTITSLKNQYMQANTITILAP